MPEAFRVEDSVLHLIGPGPITQWSKNACFWQDKGRLELNTGQILSVFSYSDTWDYQERHPDGEELAVVLEGSINFLLDDGSGERGVRVEAGYGCLVPTGVWHRIAPLVPSTLLFITPVPARTHHRQAAVDVVAR